jgi:hypothetical protein
MFMRVRHLLFVPALVMASAGSAADVSDPLRFFQGRTENIGTAKVMLHKPYRTRTVSQGRIERDGSLTLLQRVEDEGKPPHERRWQVHETGPGRYSGTMSDAVGPVTIEKVGSGYRFLFRMSGNLGVEQWLTPLGDGNSAKSTAKIRKFGMTVATVDSVIRKVSPGSSSGRSSDSP